ncbi:ankyrin repeat and zinc finger domain-containing protein 1-like, partial [Tropilaelaps mercedesae]
MAGGTMLFSLNEAVHFHQHLCNLEPICQTFEPAEDPPPSLPDLDQLEVADEKTCMICGQVFETRLHQVEHFRSDSHRLNVKGKLRGIPAFSEVEFEEPGSDCECIFASESDRGSVVEINRILLTTKNESVTSTELLARVESLKDLWLGLIIISGGHFAAAVYHSGKMIRHKTFHQYTVRKKQGGAQSRFDSKSGAAKTQATTGEIKNRINSKAKELIEDVFTTCRDDDVDELKAIVSKTDSHCLKQALTSSLDDHGNTVLHFCCRRGRLAILETVFALGADPTVTNNDGQA